MITRTISQRNQLADRLTKSNRGRWIILKQILNVLLGCEDVDILLTWDRDRDQTRALVTTVRPLASSVTASIIGTR